MVVLYKDVKNLILDFAGIYEEKEYDENFDEYDITWKYQCDMCGRIKSYPYMYKRDFFSVTKKEFVSKDENTVNIFWRKKRFLRLHLCYPCKLERGHNLETISVKTSEV